MTTIELGWVERARRGDRAAMHALLSELRPRILGMANRFLANADDAQDVCQNALIEISERLGEIRDPCALGGFIRLVTLHQCLDFRRRRATRRVPGASWDEASIEAEEQDVAERLVVQAAVLDLPATEKEALLLDLVGGLKHAEIADQAGVSVPTVRARLQSAKRKLKQKLGSLQAHPYMQLEPIVQQLIDQAFPNAMVESVENEPEMWLPYRNRIRLEFDGHEHIVDVRQDVDLDMAKLLPSLAGNGIPVPDLLAGPVIVAGTPWSLWRQPKGQNLTRWTMDGTYHRFRTATDLALDTLDSLQAFSAEAESLGVAKVTLQERFGMLLAGSGEWSQDAVFAKAVSRLERTVTAAELPLRYGSYLQYFPNWLRVEDGKVSEVVYPFGKLEDPLLGLAMVWIYDCYPFVHTGFVEQYLVRHDVSRRDLAIRLAMQSLAVIARELPYPPEAGENAYSNALFGLLDRAMKWLGG